jgi:L-threonine-O-3-phosphate decarboxylase
MLEHGGRLRRATQHYGLPLAQWLDLSTGINPNGWPVATVPAASWSRLPEDEDGLVQAAQRYYDAPFALPIAGSQAAIQTLPQLRRACRVGLLAPSYAEHHYHWHAAGHSVSLLSANQCAVATTTLDVLVVVNPNNPTGHCFQPTDLLQWHAQLRAREGWLIVDEAFVDTCSELSLATVSDREGLIVLRSLGKFFGLAGARVGFVLAARPLLTALAERLGPWSVAGPSRLVATQALNDDAWQTATRARLQQDGARLAALLGRYGLAPSGGCALFQWVITPHAAVIHDSLARSGILVRLFNAPPSVRFGLPGCELDWQRLEHSLLSLQLAQLQS